MRRIEKDGSKGPFVFKTYAEIAQLVSYFANGLAYIGAKPVIQRVEITVISIGR